MVIAEPASMAELIADCARLPESMQPSYPQYDEPREAPPWEIGDDCVLCVANLDEYGC